MSVTSKLAIVAAVSALILSATVTEARPTRSRTSGPNGSITAVKGANGSSVRARGTRQNADGSVTTGRTGAFKTGSGASGVRGATTTVNPDGSARRQSGIAVKGARGSAASSSDVTRNADGSYSGGRTSTATNNATGNSYSGSTQIDPATGKPVRTATCTDAAGAVVACPRQ